MKQNIINISGFQVSNIHPFFLIAGPCSIESKDHAINHAGIINEICKKLSVNFVYKSSFDKANRSSKLSGRGIGIEKGLNILSDVNKEFNILDYKEDGVKNIVNYTYKNPNTVSRNLYEINLLNLTLPNSSLRTGPGGFLANHSYIMVEFFSDSHDKTQIYNTNNRN